MIQKKKNWKNTFFNILKELYSINDEEDIDFKNENNGESNESDSSNESENPCDSDEEKIIDLKDLETINNVKLKLNEMCKIYYSKNSSVMNNNFNDINGNKIPKKRLNDEVNNIYMKILNSKLNSVKNEG